MFSFIRVRRARSIVEQVGVNLEEGVGALAPAERAATLAIANAMLLAASATWGKAILNAPQTIDQKLAADIVFELAAAQTQVVNEFVEPLQGRGMRDVVVAQAMRQVRATEIVLASIGMALDPGSKARVVPAWRILCSARQHANDAVALLLQYSSHSKSSPFPPIPGVKIDQAKALQFAGSVPPFLRSPAKPAARKPVAAPTPVARKKVQS